MGRLEKKMAVVTGAASGMGRGIALKLAQEGACVALLDLQDASAVRDEILAAGGDAFVDEALGEAEAVDQAEDEDQEDAELTVGRAEDVFQGDDRDGGGDDRFDDVSRGGDVA